MPRSVHLFIASDLDLSDLVTVLSTIPGVTVSQTDPGRWRVAAGGVEGDLGQNTRVDDGEPWLSRYAFVLAGTIPSGTEPRVDPWRDLAGAVQLAGHRCLLVLDLDYLPPVQDR